MHMNRTLPEPHTLCRGALGGLAAGMIVWSTAAAAATSPTPSPIADLVEQASPAVVTVYTTQTIEEANGPQVFGFPPGSPFEEFFKRFGVPRGAMPGGQGPDHEMVRRGLGSGFVFEADGYIITNDHVVDGADEVKVRLHDGTKLPAEIVGVDKRTDLALLKVDADKTLPTLTLGDSGEVRVGETVIAVGNPFGLGGTVTKGIVSAVGRDIHAGPYVDFIQTDAAINHGNSGGPLIAMDGDVIGVNSAIYSPSGGNVGVGFAIPSNVVKSVVAQLKEDGTVNRGWLGVAIQTVTPQIASAMGLDDAKGALVANVVADSPAANQLQVGDVIVSYDGKPVADSRALPPLVAATKAGDTVEIGVLRDGDSRTVEVTVGKLEPEQTASAESAAPSGNEDAAAAKLGATVASVSPEARNALGLDASVEGAVVTSLKSDGAAAEAGLAVGDVIVRVGNQKVDNPAELDSALDKLGDDYALLLVNRRGDQLFMSVDLAA